MGILLDPNKRFISIDVFYIEEVKKHGNSVFHFIRSKEEFEEWRRKGYNVDESGQTKEKVITKLTTQWTKPTWKDQNMIISRSLKTTTGAEGKTVTELDGVKYRDLKLKLCLKKWSLLDEKTGEPVAVNSEVIDLLEPAVAQELLSTFEKVTEPSNDDLKD